MSDQSYLIMWIVIAAGFAVLELATFAFVALYFALGAIAAGIVAAMGGGIVWQLVALIVAGVALLVATRPVIKAHLETPNIATNVSRFVGRSGIVTIAIDNDANTGQVRVGSEYWTARLPEDAPSSRIPVDARVTILSVEGVTARVMLRPVEEAPEPAPPA